MYRTFDLIRGKWLIKNDSSNTRDNERINLGLKEYTCVFVCLLFTSAYTFDSRARGKKGVTILKRIGSPFKDEKYTGLN